MPKQNDRIPGIAELVNSWRGLSIRAWMDAVNSPPI